ncbi:MAG: hypothetical protein WC408_01215 [Candidatus Micrarchaeia archaeon]|jgi:uncharacterized protein (UPF0333 family)
MKTRGQSALEQLLISGLAIGIVALFFAIAMNYASDSIRIAQARDAVDKIASASDYVHSLGNGAKTTVKIYLPEGVRLINMTGNRVHMRVALPSGDTDIYSTTNAPLRGTLSGTSAGAQDIVLSSITSGAVQVGDVSLSCTPSSISKTFIRNSTSNETINISNGNEAQITGITATLTGNLDQVGSITTAPATMLNAGAWTAFNVSFNITETATYAKYSGTVSTSGSGNAGCDTDITIYVISNESIPTPTPTPVSTLVPTATPDTIAPIVTGVTHSPSPAYYSSAITINATANDTNTGASIITNCIINIDNGTVWNYMNPTTSGYDSSFENASITIDPLTTGMHTANINCTDAGNNTGTSNMYAFNVTDNIGPQLSGLNGKKGKGIDQIIILSGFANETTTGNSNIINCSFQLDAGAWEPMNTSDGSYGAITENISHNCGKLNSGNHSSRFNCTDEWGNTNTSDYYNFTVFKNEFVLVTAKAPATAENYHINWIRSRLSPAGYEWDIDLATQAEISSGTKNLLNYSVVVLTSSNSTNMSAFFTKLQQFSDTGRYIVMLGTAGQYAPKFMNWVKPTDANGVSTSINKYRFQTSHPITSGVNGGINGAISDVTVVSPSNGATIYNIPLSTYGTNIASVYNYDTRGVIIENTTKHFLMFGATRPDGFYYNGTKLLSQLLDYAITSSPE